MLIEGWPKPEEEEPVPCILTHFAAWARTVDKTLTVAAELDYLVLPRTR